MITIWKYELDVKGTIEIEMPVGAEILAIQVQRNAPVIWAKVDTDKPKEKRYFKIYGTGNRIEENNLKYVGTFQMLKGELVWHVFEVIKNI